MRNENEIRGIENNDRVHKLVQFADDTTCVVENEASVHTLFLLINTITPYSGLKMNKTKTMMIWLGPWRTKSHSVLQLEVLQGRFNMLGAYIGRDQNVKFAK